MVNLMEHPYNFLNPEEERGRKIWYYGLPATIEPGYTQGDIKIAPDYSDIEQEEWWDLYKLRSHHVNIKKSNPEEENYTEKQDREMDEDRFNETKEYGVINHGDALWDGMIEWFRK